MIPPMTWIESDEPQVYHEPEYDDSEPILLGGIRIPLFTLSRGRMVALQLPLKQDGRGFAWQRRKVDCFERRKVDRLERRKVTRTDT
jgi:hypothetical protein